MKKFFMVIICFFVCSCTKDAPVSRNVVIDSDNVESNKITLSMVGDALIHSPIYKDAYKNGEYDFSSIFDDFRGLTSTSDLLFYNQETIFGGEALGYSGYPRFNTPEEFGEEMINLGFNIVSRANNHTLDKGEAGIMNSCNFWNRYPNILTHGSACTESENSIKIFELNGIKYTMLSYTVHTNGLTTDKPYYVNVYNPELVKSDVLYVRDMVDVLLVSMHWGDEYKSIPNDYQKNVASFLSDLGVDIIIGTHPHVIEPIEWIGDTLVIYSLGNFISSQSTVDDYARRIGLLVNVDIIKTVVNNEKKISLSNLNTELLFTYSNGYKDYKVIPFSKVDDSILKNYKYYKTKYDSVVKYYDKNIMTN